MGFGGWWLALNCLFIKKGCSLCGSVLLNGEGLFVRVFF